MDWTEVAGFVTGAACVALVVRRSVWNFPVGIANNLLFLVLFTGSGLYGDAGLQVLYIALAVLGWWAWLRGGPDRGPLTVRRTPRWFWPVAVVLVAAATWAVWSLLTRHTDSDVPTWDALTTSLSLVAQLMLSFKWIGNWALWIAADLVYVPLYLHKGLTLTAILYAGFVVLCAVGLLQWWRLRDAPADVAGNDEAVLAGVGSR